jgi:hypothetical protein
MVGPPRFDVRLHHGRQLSGAELAAPTPGRRVSYLTKRDEYRHDGRRIAPSCTSRRPSLARIPWSNMVDLISWSPPSTCNLSHILVEDGSSAFKANLKLCQPGDIEKMLRLLAVEVGIDFLCEHATRFKCSCRSFFLNGRESLLCHPLSVFDIGVELSSVGGHSYGCLWNHDLLRRFAQLYRSRL